uniref:EF-hand domain-containing protein n=1 Tax=Lepeophtheirus salmonis TaxID=72036 RepID=A0A0K2U3X1_LEPSM
MANTFTDKQIEEFREAFGLFDRRRDGTMLIKDLVQLLRSLGQSPTKEEIDEYISSMDDGTGMIDFPEFLSLVAKREKESVEDENELKEAFRVFDKEGNGSLTRGELEYAMRNLGEGMDEEEVNNMIKSISFDDEDKISYDKFLDIIIHPPAFEKRTAVRPNNK